jgi:hypothetical protein
MTTIDDLLRVYAEGYNAGFEAGRRASALTDVPHQGDSDGIDGISWMRIARHAESHPEKLSSWERELADSVLCSLHYGVELTPRQRSKLEWIFRSRFGGKLS